MRRVAAALAAAALAAGCGGGDDDAARVALEGDPQLLRPPTAADDRVLRGVVRNATGDPLTLRARDLTLRGADGRRVAGTAVFLSGYVRPGEAQNRGRQTLSDQEQERLGQVARIDPGDTAPLVVSWRAGDGQPVELAYPGGSLPLPRR